MQYELAHILVPYVLLIGGYSTDIDSVKECTAAIEAQRIEHETNSINWMVVTMGGDRPCG